VIDETLKVDILARLEHNRRLLVPPPSPGFAETFQRSGCRVSVWFPLRKIAEKKRGNGRKWPDGKYTKKAEKAGKSESDFPSAVRKKKAKAEKREKKAARLRRR